MNKFDRNIFEQEWESAFNDAELVPSNNVWTKVELSLANAEGGNIRRSLIIFKLLAAASVAFALSIGGLQLYNYSLDPTALTVAKTDINEPSKTTKNDFAKPLEASTEDTSLNPNNSLGIDRTVAHKNPVFQIKDEVSSNNNMSSERSYVELTPNKLKSLNAEFKNKKPKERELEMRPWLASVSIKKRNSSGSKNLWAGLNMSAGSYDPNKVGKFEGSGSLVANDANVSGNGTPIVIGEEQSGQSIGMGLNVGKRISDKFVFLSGLNYLQQSTSSLSNVTAQKGTRQSAITSLDAFVSNTSIAVVDLYEINNTYEMISVPVQAGYFVLDKRFNILLLGGFSNDLFLRRQITNTSDNTESTDATSSDDGYSIYSVSGLIGSEFSYSLGENYSISLQPQLRQSLSSFTPNGNKPTVLEVGFKFKYFIK